MNNATVFVGYGSLGSFLEGMANDGLRRVLVEKAVTTIGDPSGFETHRAWVYIQAVGGPYVRVLRMKIATLTAFRGQEPQKGEEPFDVIFQKRGDSACEIVSAHLKSLGLVVERGLVCCPKDLAISEGIIEILAFNKEQGRFDYRPQS